MTDAVPESWLRDEHVTEAERVDRLAGDLDTYMDLSADGFTGRNYTLFEHEIARYGLAVIDGWIRRRLIKQRCNEKRVRGVPDLPESVTDDKATADELAADTVAKALVAFRDLVLMPGNWDPAKGASLRTYFIGQCLFQYANVATAKKRELDDQRRLTGRLRDEWALADHGPRSGPEDDVLRSEQIAAALNGISDPKIRLAFELSHQGYTHAEIGERIGVTGKAVERMIANERDRQKKGRTA